MMRLLKKSVKSVAGVLSFFCFKKCKMDYAEARERLTSFSPQPKGSMVTRNKVETSYDLQIIIPAYNVQKYIGKCLESLKSFLDDEYSVLIQIIDDGSTDETRAIINRFADEFNGNTKVLRQENAGLSAARNAGLNTLCGEYVLFIDSDDFLPKGLKMDSLMKAIQGYDVLQAGWEIVDAEDNFISEKRVTSFAGFAWGKIFHHSVFEALHFPEGYWFEDTIIKLVIGGMKLNVKTIDEIAYCYRINPGGISAKSRNNPKIIDTFWITELCYLELGKYNIMYDQNALDRLLHQSVINQTRIRKMPRQIRKDIFVVTNELIGRFFSGVSPSKKYLSIEKAIKCGQFDKFELLALSKLETL